MHPARQRREVGDWAGRGLTEPVASVIIQTICQASAEGKTADR